MDSTKEIGKRGLRTIQAGLDVVTEAAEKLPVVGGNVIGKDKTETETLPQYVIVEDLPDELKKCYLRMLVWLVHFDDGQIDEWELCELQVLMTQLRCTAEVRRALRSSLEDPSSLDVEVEAERMLELVPPGKPETKHALRYTLVKDAVRVRRALRSSLEDPSSLDVEVEAERMPELIPSGKPETKRILRYTLIKDAIQARRFSPEILVREQPGIRQLARILGLNDKQVAFIENACVQEERILDGDVSDSNITNAAKSIMAQAAAVGVPVASVYLSGSVTGLSAAGITSGLATLGLGGVLSLSAMVTGIGVAILAGGSAYKGVRWVLGGSERNRASLRELMLQEVLRIHQRAIINLGEDMSFFGERIAALVRETTVNRAAIEKLGREVVLLARYAGALTQLGERANGLDRDLQEEAARQAVR